MSSTTTNPSSSSDPHAPTSQQWTTQRYASAAAFVPLLTSKLLHLLDPQPTDRILDVGCGDGKFTARYLASVAEVVGVDASESFVASANGCYGAGAGSGGEETGKGRFRAEVVDCRFLDREVPRLLQDLDDGAGDGGVKGFDKVVSNAALHWILRDPSTRLSTLQACYSALKPGGTFVFEMGGAGNVAEMVVALVSALAHRTGVTIKEAQEVCPWFFPDVKEMRGLLEGVGFLVEEGELELEYRPTRMEVDEQTGRPNLEGWVRMMGKQFLDRAEEVREGLGEEVVREVCELVGMRGVTGREDGRGEFGYVRLRGVARKPS